MASAMVFCQICSSFVQMTGGSHQEMRGARVFDTARTVLGLSHKPVNEVLAAFVSLPCGREIRTLILSCLRARQGLGKLGVNSTALLFTALAASSFFSHVFNSAISPGSFLSMRKTGVPAFGFCGVRFLW